MRAHHGLVHGLLSDGMGLRAAKRGADYFIDLLMCLFDPGWVLRSSPQGRADGRTRVRPITGCHTRGRGRRL